MARDGRLRPTDVLRKDGTLKSAPAGSVRGLFASQTRSVVVANVQSQRNSGNGTKVAKPTSNISESDDSLLAAIPPTARIALGLFSAACLLVVIGLVWWVKRSEQIAAVSRCDAACVRAEQWLGPTGGAENAEAVIKALADALKQKRLPKDVSNRTASLLERVKVRKAELESEKIYDAIEKAIKGRRLGEAAKLLAKYIGTSHAKRVPEAQRLLQEVQEASTEGNIVAALVQLTEVDFARALSNGEISDGKVTRPELVSVRRSLVPKLLAQATKERERAQQKIAAERRSRIADIAERAAADTVNALQEGLQGLRPQAPPGALNSPLFEFGPNVQSQLIRELKKRLIAAAGDSDLADGAEQKMLAESQRWLGEVRLRLQAEIRDATRSRASKITPTPVPPGPFRQRFEALSQKRDVNSLRTWGQLKVLIASHGLSLDDIDWGEWHMANNTPMQDFSPEEREKYTRYLRLAAAGF